MPVLDWKIQYFDNDATKITELATLDIGQDIQIQCFGDYIPKRDETDPLKLNNPEEWTVVLRHKKNLRELTLWEDTTLPACQEFVERWLRNIASQCHHLI